MTSHGFCQGKVQLLSQFFGARDARRVAPLRRGLQARQFVRRLIALGGVAGRGEDYVNRFSQRAPGGQHPSGDQRQVGLHVDVIIGYPNLGERERLLGLGRLAQFGMRLGQREAARRTQTCCHCVTFRTRQRLVQVLDRVGDRRPGEFCVPQQISQVGVGQPWHVTGRHVQSRCRFHTFVDASGQPAGPAVHGPEPEADRRRFERCGGALDGLFGHGRDVVDIAQCAQRHHQRQGGHHGVKVRQRTGVQCLPGLGCRGAASAEHRVGTRLDSHALHALRIGFGCGSEVLENVHRITRPAEHEDQIERAHRRPVVAVGSAAGADLPQDRFGVVPAAQQHQGHRTHRGRLGRTAFRGRRREPVRGVGIEQRGRTSSRGQVQLRVGRQIRIQGEQGPAHRRAHVAVGHPREPLGQAARIRDRYISPAVARRSSP